MNVLTRLGRAVYSTLFWSFFFVSSVINFFIALVIFVITFPFDRNRLVLHLFSCFWAQLLFYVNPFWHLRIENRERLPWRGAAVIVSNHQSLGDIVVLFGLYRPYKWVSKASVFKVPFLGWNMRLNGYVPLARGHRGSIVQMMRDCEKWLKRGVPVLIFPEGTRSEDETVQEFKDGAFRLAIAQNCPVIPLVLTGTARTIPKHGLIVDARADCVIHVLEPVRPEPFDGDPEAMRTHVRNLIIETKHRLEQGDGQASLIR